MLEHRGVRHRCQGITALGSNPPEVDRSLLALLQAGCSGMFHTGSQSSAARLSASYPLWGLALSRTPRWASFLCCLTPPPLFMYLGHLRIHCRHLAQNLLLMMLNQDTALQASGSQPGLTAESPAEYNKTESLA